MAMERQEAVKVLREILKECNGSLSMSNISVSPIHHKETTVSSFELKINCSLDDYSRKCIGAVIERHKLAIKEMPNSVTIYRPRT